MKYIRHMIVFVSSVMVLAACSSTPETISTTDNIKLTSYETVAESKVAPTGDKARWGGKIVAVENKKDTSEIEIVFFPENSVGRPRTSEASLGRFKAVVNGFVDPLVFESGRLITVLGEVSEPITGIIGEQEYVYPTLNALGYHMWKDVSETDVDVIAYNSFGFHHRFGRLYYSRWYDPFWHGTTKARVRVTKKNGHDQGAKTKSKSNRNNRNSGSTKSSKQQR